MPEKRGARKLSRDTDFVVSGSAVALNRFIQDDGYLDKENGSLI